MVIKMLELTNRKEHRICLGTVQGSMLSFDGLETKKIPLDIQKKFQTLIEMYVSNGLLSAKKTKSVSIDSENIPAVQETSNPSLLRRGRPRKISE